MCSLCQTVLVQKSAFQTLSIVDLFGIQTLYGDTFCTALNELRYRARSEWWSEKWEIGVREAWVEAVIPGDMVVRSARVWQSTLYPLPRVR